MNQINVFFLGQAIFAHNVTFFSMFQKLVWTLLSMSLKGNYYQMSANAIEEVVEV